MFEICSYSAHPTNVFFLTVTDTYNRTRNCRKQSAVKKQSRGTYVPVVIAASIYTDKSYFRVVAPLVQ